MAGDRGLTTYRVRIAAALLASAVVTGCAILDEGTPNVCPSTAILHDAGELVRFATVPPQGPGDVSFTTRMKYISGVCDVSEKEIEMELSTVMEAVRGPANEKGEARFVYFVAILDKDKTVLTRTKFPMIARFQGRETKLDFSEAVTVTIPKKDKSLPKDYIVYLGFEMTPDELAYNRKKQRIR
jgi:hypothetical protein